MNDHPKPLFLVAWDHKWLVGGIASATVIAGAAFTILSKPIWEAEATIVFPSRTPSILGSGGMGEQSSLAATLSGGPTPLKIYKGFLESERTLGMVAEATGLRRKEVFIARKIVDQSMESSITVSARDTNSDLALKIVAEHLAALSKINTEVSDPLYSDDSLVLGQKVKDQQAKVAELEGRLLRFQEQALTAPSILPTGLGKEAMTSGSPAKWQELQRQLELEIRKVNAAIQSVLAQVRRASGKQSVMPSNLPPVKKWRDKLVDLQYELRVKELTFAPQSPEIIQLRGAVEETQRKLKQELSAYTRAIASGALDPTTNSESLSGLMTERFGLEAQLNAVNRLAALAPGESITLARLSRELATQSAILQQLQAQYELAKVQELRNPNRWQVLDVPQIDEEPVNKSLAKNGVLAGLLGLVLGLLAALIADSGRPKVPTATQSTDELKKAA